MVALNLSISTVRPLARQTANKSSFDGPIETLPHFHLEPLLCRTPVRVAHIRIDWLGHTGSHVDLIGLNFVLNSGITVHVACNCLLIHPIIA